MAIESCCQHKYDQRKDAVSEELKKDEEVFRIQDALLADGFLNIFSPFHLILLHT